MTNEFKHFLVFVVFAGAASITSDVWPGHDMTLFFVGWVGGNFAMWYSNLRSRTAGQAALKRI